MKLTKNQSRAIEEKGKNIIVSAGAGSGKTSVLTSRIVKNLTQDGINPDEILVLTFTNAAASEMRQRIKKALLKTRPEILPLVDSAHIQTYDSYNLFLVKKYGYLIGLNGNISNASDDILSVVKNQILTNILKKSYIKKDPIIKKIIYCYCSKSDSLIYDFIYDIASILDKEGDSFIQKYKQNFLSNNYLINFKESMFKHLENSISEINYLSTNISSVKLVQKINDYFVEIFKASNFDELLESIKNLDRDEKRLTCRLHLEFDDKELYKNIKSIFDDKIRFISNFDFEKFVDYDFPTHQEIIPYLIGIAHELNEKIKEFKAINSFYSFNDISNFAMKILKSNPNVVEEIKNKFKIIMIDEYQDTSYNQEEFVKLISNNNVFLVGDVKQSIYGFRGACPEIFLSRIEQYKKDPSFGSVILMNENFRSRKEITSFINELFSEKMTSDTCGINYRGNEETVSMNSFYEENLLENHYHGFSKMSVHGIEDENKKIKVTTNMEAKAICLDILSRLKRKDQIFDREQNLVRNIKLSDFAILISKNTKFDFYADVFKFYGIPLNIVDNENLIEDDAITVIISILSFMNILNSSTNIKEKDDLRHYFASIARSFLFSYTDEELFNTLKDHLYSNVLYKKLFNFSQENKFKSISQTLINLMKEFDFINSLSKLRDPLNSLKKINLIYQKTTDMDNISYTLNDFISYLKDLSTYGILMEVKRGSESKNSVLLSNVHQSKGLEYRICYFSGLYDNRGGRDKKSYSVSSKYGFWLPLISYTDKNKNQVIQKVLLKSDKNLEYSENLRLLYVALTRVEDEGIFITHDNVDDKEEIEKVNNSFINILNGSKAFISIKEEKALEDIDYQYKEEDCINNEVTPINLISLKTQFKGAIEINKPSIINKNDFSDEQKLHLGTHFHLLFEILDFKKKDLSFIKRKNEKELVLRLLNNKLFTNINDAEIFKEYEFFDEKTLKDGRIDLLLNYKDHIDIIDYKLKNLNDEEYVSQLNFYYEYVSQTFNKPTNCYLISIFDNQIRKIK